MTEQAGEHAKQLEGASSGLRDIQLLSTVHEAMGNMVRAAVSLDETLATQNGDLSLEERNLLEVSLARSLGALTTGYTYLAGLKYNTKEIPPERIDTVQPDLEELQLPVIVRDAVTAYNVPVQNGNGPHNGSSIQLEEAPKSANQKLIELVQSKILSPSLLDWHEEHEKSESNPIKVHVTTDETVVIFGKTIDLNGADEIALFNCLLLAQGEKSKAEDIRKFGFKDRISHGATSTAFSNTMQRLEKKLNDDSNGTKIIIRTGQKIGTRYEINPQVRLEDHRDIIEDIKSDELTELLEAIDTLKKK